MEFVAKVGETLLMSDDICYTVLSTLEYNEQAYLKVVKTANEIFFPVEKIEEKDVRFVKEIVEGERYFLEFVEDTELIKALKKIKKI